MDNWKNQLFFGDNWEILRGGRIPVGSVDLIYLDPPFNSNATYNILFAEKGGEKSAAQITAFDLQKSGPPPQRPQRSRKAGRIAVNLCFTPRRQDAKEGGCAGRTLLNNFLTLRLCVLARGCH
jgi:hypothetical protein